MRLLEGGLRRCPGGDAGVVHNRPRWHLQVRVLCHRHRPHRSRPGRYGRHPTRDPRRTEACRALRRAHRPRTRRRCSSTAALELAIRPGRNPWAGERSRRSNSQGTGCITRSRVWTIVDCGSRGRITWAFRPKSRRRNPALSAKNSVKLAPRDRQYFHRYL